MKTINDMNAHHQHVLDQFVQREVVLCVSHTISELQQRWESFPDWEEELLASSQSAPDYEGAARDEGWTLIVAECGDFEGHHPDIDDAWPLVADDEDEDDAWRELCEDHRIDPYYAEVYEHWIVTPYLAELLTAQGEQVIEDIVGLGPVWCRTTTGQAIAMDGVIVDVANALPGDHWVKREAFREAA